MLRDVAAARVLSGKATSTTTVVAAERQKLEGNNIIESNGKLTAALTAAALLWVL